MLFGIMKCLEKDQTNAFAHGCMPFSMPHVAISGDVIVKRNLAPACRLYVESMHVVSPRVFSLFINVPTLLLMQSCWFLDLHININSTH